VRGPHPVAVRSAMARTFQDRVAYPVYETEMFLAIGIEECRKCTDYHQVSFEPGACGGDGPLVGPGDHDQTVDGRIECRATVPVGLRPGGRITELLATRVGAEDELGRQLRKHAPGNTEPGQAAHGQTDGDQACRGVGMEIEQLCERLASAGSVGAR
jgi:hypothetical protein